jgi:hypothetical protein
MVAAVSVAQVKADIKTVKHRLAEATLSAQRAEKVMQTSVGLSSMRSRAVDAQQRLQHTLAAEAAADRVKAAVLRKRAAELEGANGASPLQMIADVTVSKLRNEARHEDERARALLDRQANVGKEVSVLSPSARQSQSEGDAVRARWAEKVRVEKYYQTKIQTLRKQERLIEKGFDGSMDSGSSLLARASTSASNAIKLRQEAELLQKVRKTPSSQHCRNMPETNRHYRMTNVYQCLLDAQSKAYAVPTLRSVITAHSASPHVTLRQNEPACGGLGSTKTCCGRTG